MPAARRFVWLVSIAIGLVSCVPGVAAAADPEPEAFRERFPPSSIDSVSRADAALDAVGKARGRVVSDYRTAARACVDDVLVNACLDRERERQRRRLADIAAVELEANRYKRREQADRLTAERARRSAERVANEPADAERRAESRKAFDDRQQQARTQSDDRARRDASKTSPGRERKAPARRVPAAPVDPGQRAKNVAAHDAKLSEAATHQAEIDRRIATKTADRKRRADEKAAKNAATAAQTSKP